MDTQARMAAEAVMRSIAIHPSDDMPAILAELPADRIAHGVRDNGERIVAIASGLLTLVGYGSVCEVYACLTPEQARRIWEGGVSDTSARGIVVWDVTP